ncbi:MAG: copper homeostasis protein CutC [Acidobacteriaceae bacterium]
MILEICVDSVESAIASEKGGAQRVELCSDLTEGGITPSAGLIHAVRKHVGIEVFVMVRPRGGDSFYTNHEYDVMKYDVSQIKHLGADGIVLGLLDKDGNVDVERTRELVQLAHPLKVTFHRAFDMSANLDVSLEQVIETGAHRILTSGGMQTITQGAERATRLIHAARGRVHIMVGGGIRQENIHRIAVRTGATEFHCSLRTRTESPVIFRNPVLKLGTAGHDEFARYIVLEDNVHGLRKSLDRIANGAVQSVTN